MKKLKTIILGILISISLLIFIGKFRPSMKNTAFKGQLADIHVGGINDLVINLKNDPRIYFINRGLEKGLSIALIKNQIGSNTIQINTKIEDFNIFDLNDNLKEIENIEVNHNIIYQN